MKVFSQLPLHVVNMQEYYKEQKGAAVDLLYRLPFLISHPDKNSFLQYMYVLYNSYM